MKSSQEWEVFVPDEALQQYPSHAHGAIIMDAAVPDIWKNYGIRLRRAYPTAEDAAVLLGIHASAIEVYGTREYNRENLLRNIEITYRDRNSKNPMTIMNSWGPISYEEAYALHAYNQFEPPKDLAIEAHKTVQQVGPDGSVNSYETRLGRYFLNAVSCEDPYHIVILAEDPQTGKPGGFCEFSTYHTTDPEKPWGWIKGLYVHKDSQGSHLGSALVQFVKDFYDAQGTNTALMVTSGTPACEFYDQQCFTRTMVCGEVVVPTYMGVASLQETRIRRANTNHAAERRAKFVDQLEKGELLYSLCDHVEISPDLSPDDVTKIKRKDALYAKQES